MKVDAQPIRENHLFHEGDFQASEQLLCYTKIEMSCRLGFGPFLEYDVYIRGAAHLGESSIEGRTSLWLTRVQPFDFAQG